MLAALARFRLAIGLFALTACASKQAGPLVGVSDAVPDVPVARAPAGPPRAAWPDFAAARAWPEAAPASVALAHKRDGTLVHVRVEPTALPAYLALAADAPMPEGARVVAWHESPSGQLHGGYLLEKRDGVWAASVIDEHGALAPGQHDACLRCHDMAPTDHLFGRRAAPAITSANVESTGAATR